jgi:hypothetical protein
MKAHEEIMIEQTASSSKRNGGVGDVVEGTGEEDIRNAVPSCVTCHHSSLPSDFQEKGDFQEKFLDISSNGVEVTRIIDTDATELKNNHCNLTNVSDTFESVVLHGDSHAVLQLSPSRAKWKAKNSMLKRSDLSPVLSENDENSDILKCSSMMSSDLTTDISSPCALDPVVNGALFDLCTDGEETQCKRQRHRDRQCLIS